MRSDTLKVAVKASPKWLLPWGYEHQPEERRFCRYNLQCARWLISKILASLCLISGELKVKNVLEPNTAKPWENQRYQHVGFVMKKTFRTLIFHVMRKICADECSMSKGKGLPMDQWPGKVGSWRAAQGHWPQQEVLILPGHLHAKSILTVENTPGVCAQVCFVRR